MALSQVEDYADDLNVLAGQVRRNLELIGTLDKVRLPALYCALKLVHQVLSQTSHGQLDALKQQQAQYVVSLKERIKAHKSKAAGTELQASTEDTKALQALEELVRAGAAANIAATPNTVLPVCSTKTSFQKAKKRSLWRSAQQKWCKWSSTSLVRSNRLVQSECWLSMSQFPCRRVHD
jgi:hypothetical protein